MSQVLLWLLLFITLSFQTCEANSQGFHEDTEPSIRGNSVIDLVKQSSCQPRDTLVRVSEEFPEMLQYTFRPGCVLVKRCSGCCNDEAKTCMPQKNNTVEFQVLRIDFDKSIEPIVLAFVTHTSCSCRRNQKKPEGTI